MTRQHTSADTCQRLREGQHRDVHFVGQTEVSRCTATTGAKNTEAVGIIHHHARSVFLRQSTDLRQFADIAAHREDAIRDDQFACVLRNGLQLTLQIKHIAVTITEHLRITQTASVIDRGVVLAVVQDIIVLTADGGDDSEVGLETRRNGHTLLVTRELSDLFLELQVQVQRSVQETATAHTRTVFVERSVTGFDNCLVLREAEVVVRT